jgi:hypothetical protein
LFANIILIDFSSTQTFDPKAGKINPVSGFHGSFPCICCGKIKNMPTDHIGIVALLLSKRN